MAWVFESGQQGKKGWVFGEDNSDVTASGDSRSLEERIRARQREEERLKKQQEEYRAQQEEKEAARERENALATAQVMTGQQDENTAYTPIQLPIAESEEAAKPKYSFSDIVKLQQNMERGNELMENTRLRNAASEVMAGQGLTDEERIDVYIDPAYTMTEKDKEQARRIIREYYDAHQTAPAFGKDAAVARRDALAAGEEGGKIAQLEQKVNGSPAGYVAEKAAGGAAAALEGIWNMWMNLGDASGSAEGMAARADRLGVGMQDAEQMGRAIQKSKETYGGTDPLKSNRAAEYASGIDARYNNPDGALKVAGEVSSAIGGMIPSIAANAAAPGSGMAVMFSGAAGNAMEEALAEGADQSTALVYGILSGGVEVATEKMFGGIPGLGIGSAEDAVKKISSKLAASPAVQNVILKAVDMLGEGAEEYVSEVAGAYLQKLYNGDDRGVVQTFLETQPDAAASFLLGALTSGVMNIGEVPGTVRELNTERALQSGESITVDQAQRYGEMMADLYEPGTPQWQQAMDRVLENANPSTRATMRRLAADQYNAQAGADQLGSEEWYRMQMQRYRDGLVSPLPVAQQNGGAAQKATPLPVAWQDAETQQQAAPLPIAGQETAGGATVQSEGSQQARQRALETGTVSEELLDYTERMAQRSGRQLEYVFEPDSQIGGIVDDTKITINLANPDHAFSTAVHEVGHTMKIGSPQQWASFEQAMLRLADSSTEMESIARGVVDAYLSENSRGLNSMVAEDGSLNEAALNEEISLKLAEEIVKDPARITKAVEQDRGLIGKLLDFVRGLKNQTMIRFGKSESAMLDEAERTLVNLLRGRAVKIEGERYSIQRDADGKPFVEIDEDILAGVPNKDKIKTVAAELRRRYPDGFNWRGWKIDLNTKGIREFTRSKNTERIQTENRTFFNDKLRTAANLDEIIEVADNIRNEDPKHPRKDNLRSFNRADVRIRVGKNDYAAEVVTAIKPSTKEIFYDIVNLKPIKIEGIPASSLLQKQHATISAGIPSIGIIPTQKSEVKIGDDSKNSLTTLPNTESDLPWREYARQRYSQLQGRMAGSQGKVNAADTAGVQNTVAVGTATATQDGPVQNATPFPIHDSTQEMATENTVPLPIAGDSDPRVESLVFGDSDPRMTAREQSLLQGDTPPEWVGRGQNAQTESQPQPLPIAGEQTAKSRQYQTRAENQFVNEVAETLSIPGGARRDVLKPAAQRLTQEIRETGRVSAQTADAVFDEVYRQGRITLDEFYNEYKDLKAELRRDPITLAQIDRDSHTYQEFRKSNFGVLNLVNKGGTPVYVKYQELSATWPELFPADIINPADQLTKMAEVARLITKTEADLDTYYGDDPFWRDAARESFDRSLERLQDEMGVVTRYDAEQAQKSSTKRTAKAPSVEQVQTLYRTAQKLSKKVDSVVRNTLLTDSDNQTVESLLRGKISPEQVTGPNSRDILRVYEAKKAVQDVMGPIRQYKADLREERVAAADKFLENSIKWKDKLSGLQYSTETMERNLRDVAGSDAQQLIDYYITPVHKHEAAATRWKNQMREKVRELGLNQTESEYLQLYGELQGVEAAKEMNLFRTDNEIENLRVQEARYYNEHKDKIDKAKVEKALEVFRGLYNDIFAEMNRIYAENGYAPVEYRQGYFPHFTEKAPDGLLGKIASRLGFSANNDTLPTDIAGLTYTFRPGRKYNPFAKQRTGYETVYDAVKGFDKYLETAADVIYHTGDIQNLRALESAIRSRYSDAGIREQVRKIENSDELTDSMKEEILAEYTRSSRGHLSKLAQELTEYTNMLAGKKSLHDRTVETDTGRAVYQVMSDLENKVAANMVAVNPGSWLTNFIPITQASAEVSVGNLVKAAKETAKSWFKDDGFVEGSTFLTNRQGSDPLSQTLQRKVSSTMSKPMEWIDMFTANVVTRGKYYENIKAGMTPELAMDNADSFAASIMADRSKGALPTYFNRKNPVTRIFTMYQVEVNNQLRYLLKDLPRAKKDEAVKSIALALLKYFVGAYLYNDVYEYFIGRRPALDVIGLANETVGDLTGYQLPNLMEAGSDMVKGDGPDFTTQKKGLGQAVATLGEGVAEELPFVGGLLGGGRVPISSALPDIGSLSSATAGLISGEMASNKAASTIGKELAKPFYYLLPPFGGGQLKKAVEGISAVAQGGVYGLNNDGEEILRFPIEDQSLGTYLQAGLFGPYALPTGKEYAADGYKSKSVSWTQEWEEAKKQGISYDQFEEWKDLAKEVKADKNEAGNSIAGTKAKNLRQLLNDPRFDFTPTQREFLMQQAGYDYYTLEKVEDQ